MSSKERSRTTTAEVELPDEEDKLAKEISQFQLQVKESSKELASVQYEASRLEMIVNTLKIPNKKDEYEAKKLNIQLEKMEKIIVLKNKADDNTLRMNIKQLEQKEAGQRLLRERIDDMDYLCEEQLRECLLLLETVKEFQNKRMTVMMEIIDENVHRSKLIKNKYNRECLSTTGEQFGRRDSSISDLLGNYDPEVRALLEKSIKDNQVLHDDLVSKDLQSLDYKPHELSKENPQEENNKNTLIKSKRDFATAFNEIGSKEKTFDLKGEVENFPIRGKDYLVSKTKKP